MPGLGCMGVRGGRGRTCDVDAFAAVSGEGEGVLRGGFDHGAPAPSRRPSRNPLYPLPQQAG